MKDKSHQFKIGDSVRVKSHRKDPDLNIDIGGWQGRISEINERENLICIDWDSITLQNMPSALIAECEEEGLGWDQMYLGLDEVDLVEARDTEADVDRVLDRLEAQHRYDYLGSAGQRLQRILAGVDSDDHWAVFKAWDKHLRQVLKFPFEAEVSELLMRGPLRIGDRVRVQEIVDVDDASYGIIVKLKLGRKTYHFPLCDLQAIDERSSNYQIIQDYAVWFANQ
jgi:hypothetical protein